MGMRLGVALAMETMTMPQQTEMPMTKIVAMERKGIKARIKVRTN
jgi:hypothetical protein